MQPMYLKQQLLLKAMNPLNFKDAIGDQVVYTSHKVASAVTTSH
jgi:hypothetical protein